MARIDITDTLFIDDSELVEDFMRASGPGGQNVNKVSTACELRFDARGSKSLPDGVAIRLMKAAGSKLTKDGVLVIRADQFRTQEANRKAARQRLIDLIRSVATPPKKRIATRPTLSAKRERTDTKKKRGTVKSLRRVKIDRD
jgi:ribosome-associated protein